MHAEKPKSLSDWGITAITFDLDDTLWPCAPVIAGAEKVYFEWVAEHFPKAAEQYQLAEMTAMRRQLLVAEPALKNCVTELRRRASVDLLKPFGASDADVDELMSVCLAARQLVELYDDVPAALQQLSQHYPLGSLTNGNACLKTIGIDHHFKVELAATMTLPAKPAADMFLQAFEVMGVTADAVLHVGDNPQTDVEAARKLGCKTAWINRDTLDYPTEIAEADINIVDLNELVALVN